MTPQLLRTLFLFAHLLTIVNAQQNNTQQNNTQQSIDLGQLWWELRSVPISRNTPPTIALGDAVVSENYINLTRTDDSGDPATNSVGRVVGKDSLQFNATTSFRTEIRFKITPRNGSNGDFSLVGDGLAFFMSSPAEALNIPVGSSGGNLGIFNSSGMRPSTFAVEFDTDPNTWDPRYMHVGIDIESRTSRNTTRVDTSIVDKDVRALILYKADTNLISVAVDADSKRFEVSYVYNLSSLFPDNLVRVGISAATGALTAKHDVFLWAFEY